MVELSALACRVIGVLLEKERTVPATYPVTPKGVVSGCNQTTGRDPIMSITEAQVDIAIRELRDAKLARTVHASHGARTEKYRQVLDEALDLDDAERAVITLLLLRSAQTPGELRSRSDRLHAFESVDEVDRALAALSTRDEPLVEQLERRPGQKEQRWIHLLGTASDRAAQVGADGVATAPSTAAVTQTAPTPRAPLSPELAPLTAFVGSWRGTGEGRHPTVEPFAYAEVVTLEPAGKAVLAYHATTTTQDDGVVIHDESGFLRSRGGGVVELVVAQGSGVVEVSEGLVDDRDLFLTSMTVAASSSADGVGSVERRYAVDGDTLTSEVTMGRAGESTALLHLRTTLRRQG